MRLLLAILFITLLFSCKNGEQDPSSLTEPSSPVVSDTLETESSSLNDYSSEKWNFQVKVPVGFEVVEMQLPGETPVVNIYDTANVKAPPYAIHEDASLAYTALLPEGYGVDAPAGKQVKYKEWPEKLPLEFEVDEEQSIGYLLENEEVWAYSFRLENPPEGWNEHATVFIHHKVNNYKAECFSKSNGEEKTMSQCNPMGGKDEIKYSGELNRESAEQLMEILFTLKFG